MPYVLNIFTKYMQQMQTIHSSVIYSCTHIRPWKLLERARGWFLRSMTSLLESSNYINRVPRVLSLPPSREEERGPWEQDCWFYHKRLSCSDGRWSMVDTPKLFQVFVFTTRSQHIWGEFWYLNEVFIPNHNVSNILRKAFEFPVQEYCLSRSKAGNKIH